MSSITVIGGTGYAGSAIVREAARRGHRVRSVSRNLPERESRVEGVDYWRGSMLDPDARRTAIGGSDVAVSSLSARGELDGRIAEVDAALAALAGKSGVRFGVVGGFSSLRAVEGGPRMADSDDLPPQFASGARQMSAVLTAMTQTGPEVDWFYISPAQKFGAFSPGDALGRYRVGGEVAFYDEDGVSAISGADFALAVLDEIEKPGHHRAQFSVAY